MADELASLLVDFCLLVNGHAGEALNEVIPDASAGVHLNAPAQCEARGRLVALFGEKSIIALENHQLGLMRRFGQLRFHEGRLGAKRRRRTITGPLEAAVTNGLQAVVRELQRPKMALFNAAGDVVGSEPAAPAER